MMILDDQENPRTWASRAPVHSRVEPPPQRAVCSTRPVSQVPAFTPIRRQALLCPLPGTRPFGRSLPHDRSRSALVLSQHLDGLLQKQSCEHVAARSQPGFTAIPSALVRLASQRIRPDVLATHGPEVAPISDLTRASSRTSARSGSVRASANTTPGVPGPGSRLLREVRWASSRHGRRDPGGSLLPRRSVALLDSRRPARPGPAPWAGGHRPVRFGPGPAASPPASIAPGGAPSASVSATRLDRDATMPAFGAPERAPSADNAVWHGFDIGSRSSRRISAHRCVCRTPRPVAPRSAARKGASHDTRGVLARWFHSRCWGSRESPIRGWSGPDARGDLVGNPDSRKVRHRGTPRPGVSPPRSETPKGLRSRSAPPGVAAPAR